VTLADFATFSTAISGFAVTASLIYLALQTHQNTGNTRALINQGRIDRIADTRLAAADAEIAAALIIANGGEPTPERIRQEQFSAYCNATFYGWQDSFSQHHRGLLDDDIYSQMREAVVKALAQPGYRAEWEKNESPRHEVLGFCRRDHRNAAGGAKIEIKKSGQGWSCSCGYVSDLYPEAGGCQPGELAPFQASSCPITLSRTLLSRELRSMRAMVTSPSRCRCDRSENYTSRRA
jgi:hypothetical protein